MADSENNQTEGQDAESVQNLGFKLKSAREAQDLSLDEIAAELRIGVDSLNALEECRFDELGAQVFGKGYLKQYGARLGLDVAELVADYEQSVGQQIVEIPPSQTITLRDDRQIKVWVGAGIALLLMAAILWVWWWLGTGDDAELALEATVVESAPLAEVPQDGLEAEDPEQPVFDAVVAADTESESVPVFESAPVTLVESEAALGSGPQIAVSEASPTDGPQLEILFVGESWAEITSDTGERLYYDLGRTGSRARVPADRGLNLFFGNVAGVELSIEGQPVSIPASFRRGELAQFDLDALVDIADLVNSVDAVGGVGQSQ